MGKHFDNYIENITRNNTLYQHTFRGNDICGRCIYRRAWQNRCAKFNATIERVNQGNGGFHHLPCTQCLDYTLQKCDLQYYINSYKKKFPERETKSAEEIMKGLGK